MNPESGLLLPEAARLVHIGPHKTGSTAIQVSLHKARPELRKHGVHYAGTAARPRKAGWALGLRGFPDGYEQPPIRHWEELVEDVASAGDLRVAVSNEDFGRAKKPQIRQIVRDLGGERVHVVAVARRLDRFLPSQWQERVKAGDERPYDEWLRIVLDRGNPEFSWDRRNVWHSHDIGALVSRWVETVGEDGFTLIVSDESDRSTLPRTFESMLGLPAETLQLHPEQSNRGLTWGETELVRSVNLLASERGWSRDQRRPFVRHGVLTDLQARPASTVGPRTPPLPDWAVDRIRELSERRVDTIRALGVRVVGDPEAMRVPDDVLVGQAGQESPLVAPETAGAAVAAVIDVAFRRAQVPRPLQRPQAPAQRSLVARARGRARRTLAPLRRRTGGDPT